MHANIYLYAHIMRDLSSPAHRHAVYLEERQGRGGRVGVEAVRQLVQVVSRLGLHLNHLRARGHVLRQRGLVARREEGDGLVQLVEQRHVDGAEAPVEGRRLVGGRDVHEIRGLRLVVQVVHGGDQAGAGVHLELAVGAGHQGVSDGSSIAWTTGDVKL